MPKPRPKPHHYTLLAIAGLFVLALAILLWAFMSQPSSKSLAGTRAAGTTAQATPMTTAIITITATGFMPHTLTINPNTDVIWVNEDVTPHLPAADPYPSHTELPSLVAPKALGQHETYTYLFTRPGTIGYVDELEPTMGGEVVVR